MWLGEVEMGGVVWGVLLLLLGVLVFRVLLFLLLAVLFLVPPPLPTSISSG